jgi:lipase ATG15
MRRRPLCSSTSRVTATLLLSFLAVSSAAAAEVPLLPLPPTSPHLHNTEKDFTLRHIYHHGTYKYPELHRRLDVPKQAAVYMLEDEDTTNRQPVPALRAKSEIMSIERLVHRDRDTIDGILDYGRMRGKAVQLAAEDWTIDEVPGPNVTDKGTVLTFARMASDAYILEPGTGDWEDVKGGFNYTEDFGWQSDGLRGHIFADTENSTVVIGLKGTSQRRLQTTRSTTICISAAVVGRAVSSSGAKSATVKPQHIHAIQLALLPPYERKIATTPQLKTCITMSQLFTRTPRFGSPDIR